MRGHSDLKFCTDGLRRRDHILKGGIIDRVAVIFDNIRFPLRIFISSRKQIQLNVGVGNARRVLQRDVHDLMDDHDESLSLDTVSNSQLNPP